MAASTAASHICMDVSAAEAGGAKLLGITNEEQFLAAKGDAASYVCLTGSLGACPKAAIEAAGLKFAHVPFEVPADLTAAKAAELHAVLSSLPSPIMVQCASATRASAAFLLHLALKSKWSVAQAVEFGKEHSFKCMSSEPLRNWVIANLDGLTPAAAAGALPTEGLIFRQLFDYATWTYTYILGCAETREAVIIDPVFEKADRDTHLAHDLGLTLKYSINTHVHADHVSGSTALRARNPGLKSVVSEVSKGKSDMYVNEGDVLSFGKRHLRCLSTSGHTDGCMSFVLDDETMVFTGDALFVRGCGRTDFQQGNPAALYDNIHGKIYSLPEACVVYPGHDYNGHHRSTVGEEKRFNPRLNKTREEFIHIMKNLNLPYPRLIDVSVPANMADGIPVEEAPKPAA